MNRYVKEFCIYSVNNKKKYQILNLQNLNNIFIFSIILKFNKNYFFDIYFKKITCNRKIYFRESFSFDIQSKDYKKYKKILEHILWIHKFNFYETKTQNAVLYLRDRHDFPDIRIKHSYREVFFIDIIFGYEKINIIQYIYEKILNNTKIYNIQNILDIASYFGNLNSFEWIRNNDGFKHKYIKIGCQGPIGIASTYGHISVLNYFYKLYKNTSNDSDLFKQDEYTCQKSNIKACLYDAVSNGHLNVVKWFYKKGFICWYDGILEVILEWLIRHKQIHIIKWFHKIFNEYYEHIINMKQIRNLLENKEYADMKYLLNKLSEKKYVKRFKYV